MTISNGYGIEIASQKKEGNMDFGNETYLAVTAVLLAISEALGSIKFFKANSIFQLISGIIQFVAGKK